MTQGVLCQSGTVPWALAPEHARPGRIALAHGQPRERDFDDSSAIVLRVIGAMGMFPTLACGWSRVSLGRASEHRRVFLRIEMYVLEQHHVRS